MYWYTEGETDDTMKIVGNIAVVEATLRRREFEYLDQRPKQLHSEGETSCDGAMMGRQWH